VAQADTESINALYRNVEDEVPPDLSSHSHSLILTLSLSRTERGAQGKGKSGGSGHQLHQRLVPQCRERGTPLRFNLLDSHTSLLLFLTVRAINSSDQATASGPFYSRSRSCYSPCYSHSHSCYSHSRPCCSRSCCLCA
jgi:hypothetical protein